MFSSRNIHLAILGIILGASTAYVVAFYRVQPSSPPPLTSSEAEAGAPAGHPEMNNEQMLEALKKAVEVSPNNPEMVKRYAVALFELGQFSDAEKWFAKAVDLEPNSVDLRSMYGAVLWRMGNKDAAARQLEATLRLDPQNIPSLHGLTLLALEGRDAARARKLIQQIESIEPTYNQLPELRSRLQALGDGK
jgi:Flp pilus assembly protein TadD